MSTSTTREPRERILSPSYAATTIGLFSLIAFAAFESMAVTTIMPTVARGLDGFDHYALSFAAPFASGVVGMVAAGMWADRRGPLVPLVASLVTFSAGLVVCGTASSMEVFVLGRIVQGLGGGLLTVVAYVLVGLVYPARLQAAVFASFAAAWVLPALFGPGVAALVASTVGWRWVFLGIVALVAVAAALVTPTARRQPVPEAPGAATWGRLGWSVLAAGAVLALELLGSGTGWTLVAAGGAFALVVVGLRPLLPAGTLTGGRGLPSVIATRGLLAASFFCAEAYIVYVLQERWDLSPGQAGVALTLVGVVWASSSQASSRLGERVSHGAAFRFGTSVVLVGIAAIALVVWLRTHGTDVPAVAPIAAYVFASIGMGFAYPRTGVAMLASATDEDRGFNSSALTVADSLGAALALSVSGIAYAAAERAGLDPFPVVYLLAVAIGAVGVLAGARAAAAPRSGAVADGGPPPGLPRDQAADTR
ncbi:MFS transporter [Microbacterium sp. ARD31]|uniref:MFS transporter n=1 Tax=Microbacterium sp. ARD31 TaxID=2962576 RepID=UPI0028818504|nr:MFS transporter [Microbacterium sp. ARD31]MDT0185036.1 MFS transporter [Microbacterium sp. ARD31]